MNELVEKLSSKDYQIIANNPEKSAAALKERIELNYVHILFEETGTELGMKLDHKNCQYSDEMLHSGEGTIHLEGVLMLNFDKIRCIADIDLKDMRGSGKIAQISEADYNQIVNLKDN